MQSVCPLLAAQCSAVWPVKAKLVPWPCEAQEQEEGGGG